ncbi:response regulator [Aquibacillus albus]|uniref:Two-component system NarL family response regulator n=1 Tax=Aquibacillus albus TaxID=1168171 RepID=A0ABS2N0D3_9BACI|nr:response regulator transcription factor [Aquibacillus albus]MBM7571610.1 two-component system NarL family response regulator [Aquibacillus albus]
MSIRLIIADDHQVVRKGLTFFLQTQNEMEIIGEASSGKEVLELLKKNEVDVVLLDVQMPTMDGVETTKAIRSQFENVKILMLTSFSDYDSVIPAIKAGANGYQLKDIDPIQLAESIRKVYQGETAIDAKAAAHLFAHVNGTNETMEDQKLDDLTNRELDVLKEIREGKSNKEIAADLFITEKTVKTHVSNLLSKLELHDRTQAALYAVKHLKK